MLLWACGLEYALRTARMVARTHGYAHTRGYTRTLTRFPLLGFTWEPTSLPYFRKPKDATFMSVLLEF